MPPNQDIRTNRYIIPPIESGYQLDPIRGMFDVVYPLGTDKTNLVSNPKVAVNTTGYGALNAAIARATYIQRRGIATLEVTPTSNLNGGGYYGTVPLLINNVYWFSCDFKGRRGVEYKLYFATTGGVLVGSPRTFTANGLWQRPVVNLSPPSSDDYRLYFTKSNSADLGLFYVNGLQSELNQVTTYIDGDQVGFVRNRQDYYWLGTPNASPSVRIGMSRSGGAVISLDQVGFRLLSIIGLGLGGIINQLTPLALGGAYYGSTVYGDRQFSLVGQLDSPTGYEDLGRRRQGLIDLLKPDLVSPPQPLILRYTPVDDCGTITGETNEIVCLTDGDIGGVINNVNSERIPLTFRLFMPFVMQQVGNSGSIIGYEYALTSNYAAKRIAFAGGGGTWSDAPILNSSVFAITYDAKFNRIYFGGDFTIAGGVTVNRVFYLDNTGVHALNAAGTVGVNGSVYALTVDAVGRLWIGGSFTTAGGAATKGLARYNPITDAFTVYNVATTTFVSVKAIAVDQVGRIHVGGDFTGYDGDADGDYITSLTSPGVTFVELGSGVDDVVNALTVGLDGKVYLAGEFEFEGGSPLMRVGYWDWNDSTFHEMAGGLAAAGGIPVTLAVDTFGNILLGGLFSEFNNSVFINNAAKWDGNAWAEIASGLDTAFAINDLIVSGDGTIYGVGVLTGGPSTGEFGFSTRGGDWKILDALVQPPPNAIGKAVEVLPNGDLYVGFNAASVVTTAAVTSITNTGSAPIGPTFTFTGPGTLRTLKNLTTNKTIYFNLSLQVGEVAVLDLSSQSRITFVSSFQGNILSGIAPGSQESEFNLRSGLNYIALNIWGEDEFETDSDTAAFMTWRITSHSIDNAAIGRYVP